MVSLIIILFVYT